MIDIETGLPDPSDDPIKKLLSAVRFLLLHHAHPSQIPDKETAQAHLDNLKEVKNVPSN